MFNCYWEDKESRAIRAKEHTKLMDELFKPEIEYSLNNSFIYNERCIYSGDTTNHNSEIVLEDLDSVSAVLKYSNEEEYTAVLNFADYKVPGGMFLAGSRAQEESLCHESTLYNVLSQCYNYYGWNRQNLNKGLYKDRSIYSKDIIFIRDEDAVKCDVITCAAPNIRTARRWQNVEADENKLVLIKRIQHILNVAAVNQVDNLILGAFGCGVFGQDPLEVAMIFKLCLEQINNPFKKVIFAVPKGRGKDAVTNYKMFEYVFGGDKNETD